MEDNFTYYSPCIKCADNGIEFSRESPVCKKCNYFILVSSLRKILSENAGCKYCIHIHGDDFCNLCDFELDLEKLLSEYKIEDSIKEDIIDEEVPSTFSETDDINVENSFDDFLDGFIDGWLEEDDEDDEWED